MKALRFALIIAALTLSAPCYAASEGGALARVKSFFSGSEKSDPERPVLPERPQRERPAMPNEDRTPQRIFERPAMPMPDLPNVEGIEPVKDVDAKALDNAKEIVQILAAQQQDRPMMRSISLMRATPFVMQANQGNEAKVSKVIEDVNAKLSAEQSSNFKDSGAKAYAHLMSASELEKLRAFVESSAGKKFLKINDVVMAYQRQSADAQAMNKTKQIIEALARELKQNDLKVPPELETK